MKLARTEDWQHWTFLALFALPLGCSAAAEAPAGELEGSEATLAPIIGGKPASAYPESVLVDMSQGGSQVAACSGTLIAPRVVLTAGHCVHGFDGWHITAPFAGGKTAYAAGAETYDWKVESETVDPSVHDIGLVYLATPIDLASYPAIASSPVADGTSIVNIGRIQDGHFSSSALFVSPPITVYGGEQIGYPFDYGAVETIESGDSGGPDMLAGTHTIVAVNSGAGGGTEVLARVDLLHAWIKGAVDSHGGAGAVDGGGGSSGGGGGAVPSGPTEQEPNDSYTQPNLLGAQISGKLGGGDQDWFLWSISKTAYYDVELGATGDAEIMMWKLVSGRYYQVPNVTGTSIAHTSTGAGKYFLAAWSPSGQAQTYTITLQK